MDAALLLVSATTRSSVFLNSLLPRNRAVLACFGMLALKPVQTGRAGPFVLIQHTRAGGPGQTGRSHRLVLNQY